MASSPDKVEDWSGRQAYGATFFSMSLTLRLRVEAAYGTFCNSPQESAIRGESLTQRWQKGSDQGAKVTFETSRIIPPRS
jgi:hypothetical protein